MASIRTLLTGARESAGGVLHFLDQFLQQFLRWFLRRFLQRFPVTATFRGRSACVQYAVQYAVQHGILYGFSGVRTGRRAVHRAFHRAATEQSTEQSTGSRHLYQHLYQHLYRHLNRASTGSMGRYRSFADVISETLARDAAQIRIMVHDVEKVSGETMTETMTIGGKNEKRDTTHRRIALRVAPPGLEPGLS